MLATPINILQFQLQNWISTIELANDRIYVHLNASQISRQYSARITACISALLANYTDHVYRLVQGYRLGTVMADGRR